MSDNASGGDGGGRGNTGAPIGDDPWGGRVAFSTDSFGLPFAYRPGELHAHTPRVAEALSLLHDRGERTLQTDSSVGAFTRLVGVGDVLDAVHELRINGISAQPNHVFFAHCGPGCPPSPSSSGGYGGASANAVSASPVYASPVYASPVYASGVGAPRRSSATPAQRGPTTAAMSHLMEEPASGRVEVFVLDTGLAASTARWRPAEIRNSKSIVAPKRTDRADPDPDRHGYLDPAAGHSTFIAGLIKNVAPGTGVVVHKVLAGDGSGDEHQIAQAINALAPKNPARSILNLSFGGYALDQPYVLTQAINGFLAQGGAVVSSAGNDGTCRPTYPAALPRVIGVGAIGPTGPAPFTNYGPWVSACAPGVDLISAFFNNWEDPSGTYDGWAIWSGTSFAAPLVVGALARSLAQDDQRSVDYAVREVIELPWLMRIPNLGTVVNVV